MKAVAEITRHKSYVEDDLEYIYIRCSECRKVLVTTIVREGAQVRYFDSVRQHLDQHNDPTRAPDIEYLEYNVEAWCTVCVDRVGEVDFTSSGTLECNVCGTVWDSDGEHGEREV